MINGIHKFIGLKYEKLGRTFKGVDCWGLCVLFFKEIYGINIPNFIEEEVLTEKDIYKTVENKKSMFVELNVPEKDCFVLIKIRGLGTHIGLMLNEEDMLHIQNNKHTSCIEKVFSDKWKHRILGFYKYESIN